MKKVIMLVISVVLSVVSVSFAGEKEMAHAKAGARIQSLLTEKAAIFKAVDNLSEVDCPKECKAYIKSLTELDVTEKVLQEFGAEFKVIFKDLPPPNGV